MGRHSEEVQAKLKVILIPVALFHVSDFDFGQQRLQITKKKKIFF